jgi:hypothetical protein
MRRSRRYRAASIRLVTRSRSTDTRTPVHRFQGSSEAR